MEVERVWREWEIELRWAPFFLDPSIPPEGRTRTPQTTADSPKSALEERGERLGIEFRRGRTFQPHSHLALQAGEWAQEHAADTPQLIDYHRRLFRAFFTEHENVMDAEVLVRHAIDAGMDGESLRRALADGAYREQVDTGIEHSYAIGVSAIPTFIFDDQYAIVGAHEHEIFERVLTQLGAVRRATPLTPPAWASGSADERAD